MTRSAVDASAVAVTYPLAGPHCIGQALRRRLLVALGRHDMIAVIFEVWPAEGHRDDYLALAAWLRDDLARIDGFLSVERFQSLAEPTKLLSLSFWRDEQAVTAWRTQGYHREGQVRGRAGLFADYRLRVASVLRDYGLNERAKAPADSRALHDEGGVDW